MGCVTETLFLRRSFVVFVCCCLCHSVSFCVILCHSVCVSMSLCVCLYLFLSLSPSFRPSLLVPVSPCTVTLLYPSFRCFAQADLQALLPDVKCDAGHTIQPVLRSQARDALHAAGLNFVTLMLREAANVADWCVMCACVDVEPVPVSPDHCVAGLPLTRRNSPQRWTPLRCRWRPKCSTRHVRVATKSSGCSLTTSCWR